MKFGKTFILLLLLINILNCSNQPVNEKKSETPSPLEVRKNIDTFVDLVDDLNAVEAMALADIWGTENPYVESFVTSKEITFTFTTINKQVTIPLPSDKMVVSIAPYIKETHPCEIHNMSGCQGELIDVPVGVFAKDSDDNIILNQVINTQPNGFIDLWLPRDKEISLILEAKGKKASGSIGTFEDSFTCITTFKLL